MENQTKIKCPNCGTAIDVEDILSHQLEEGIRKKFNAQLAAEKKKFEKEFEKEKKKEMDTKSINPFDQQCNENAIKTHLLFIRIEIQKIK